MHDNIENLIANIVKRHETKLRQLEKMQEICVHLTSDDGVWIDAEMYENNIVRFLIKGTRCSMTITYNTLTWELLHKPRGEKPWYVTGKQTNLYKIFERVEELK